LHIEGKEALERRSLGSGQVAGQDLGGVEHVHLWTAAGAGTEDQIGFAVAVDIAGGDVDAVAELGGGVAGEGEEIADEFLRLGVGDGAAVEEGDTRAAAEAGADNEVG